MIDQLKKIIAPLQRRILLMVARGVIKTVTDSSKIQKLQLSVLADEVTDKIDRIQEYGFTSRPKAGAQAVILFLGGNRDHGVVIATEDGQVRPVDLDEGESAIYSFEGYQVRMRNDRIEIGKGGTWETTVMGETLAALLGDLISKIASHVHGPPGSPATTAADFTALKTNYIDNDAVLAKDGGAF